MAKYQSVVAGASPDTSQKADNQRRSISATFVLRRVYECSLILACDSLGRSFNGDILVSLSREGSTYRILGGDEAALQAAACDDESNEFVLFHIRLKG